MNIMDVKPIVDSEVFVAPNASLIGNVKVHSRASVWYGAVLRADSGEIIVGPGSSIRDRVVVQVSSSEKGSEGSENQKATRIGRNVNINCGAVLGACQIGDEVVVGMGAVVKDGATVGRGAVVGPGSVVEQNSEIGAGEVWEGAPAQMARKIEAGEKEHNRLDVENYVMLAEAHANECGKTHEQIESEKLKRELMDERDLDYQSHLGIIEENEEDVDRQVKMILKDRKQQAAAGSPA